MDERYDVIIIGNGAGGGTLAHRLAPSGKKVLILERGDWLPREARNWSVADVFADNRYISPDTWYLPGGKSFQPQVHYFVGGATKMFGAAVYRLRKEDFGVLQHHDGVSPAWPVGYEEFEPCYTEAEQLYQVHGERGIDPTEPPASAPWRCVRLPLRTTNFVSQVDRFREWVSSGGFLQQRRNSGDRSAAHAQRSSARDPTENAIELHRGLAAPMEVIHVRLSRSFASSRAGRAGLRSPGRHR